MAAEDSAQSSVKPVTITVDSQELRAGTLAALQKFPGVTATQAQLPSGDYVIAEGVAIERKEATDFVNSVMSGHLFEQMARMQIEYRHSIVLIEGDPYKTRSAITPEAIDGALSYISLLSAVDLMWSPSVARTPHLIWRMAIHATHGLGYELPLRASPKPKSGPSAARYIVEGLPGCGASTAKALLGHFGSVRAIFAASEDELRAVKGVGPKTAATIRLALDSSS